MDTEKKNELVKKRVYEKHGREIKEFDDKIKLKDERLESCDKKIEDIFAEAQSLMNESKK